MISPRRIQTRLFLTGWIVLSLHFATDFTREHFLVLSIVEDHTFRLDKYAAMHDDIFSIPGRGFYHNANPGASMIASVPYSIFLPVVNALDRRFARPAKSTDPIQFNDPRPARAKFFAVARQKGLHIRFALAGMITAIFCMAPLAALSGVVILRILTRIGAPLSRAILLSLLYLFGTPIFFRAGYLNQNLLVAVFGILGFYLVRCSSAFPTGAKAYRSAGILAGLCGGFALLCDYSGIIILIGLWLLLLRRATGSRIQQSSWYAAGALGPLALLWFYQWSCFGNPFFPPQHSMAAANPNALVGYRGFSAFSFDLFRMLLFDYRFGLFVVSPVLLLALTAPFVPGWWGRPSRPSWTYNGASDRPEWPPQSLLPGLWISIAFVLFFSCVQYTRIQWITGIRYLVAAVPFLFLLTAIVLNWLPKWLSLALGSVMLFTSWSLAMVRSQAGPLDSVRQVFQSGPQLPWLTTINRVVPVPHYTLMVIVLFLIAAFLIFAVWRFPRNEPA